MATSLHLDNVEDIYPLSPLQQLMLLHYLSTRRPHNQIEHLRFTLEGDLTVDNLSSAWAEVLNRHASLRTEFHWKNLSQPVQVVRRHLTACIESDLPDLESVESGRAANFFAAILQKGMQLDRAPLVRLALQQTAATTFHILITYHPIVLDGWSIAIVLRDFFAALQGQLDTDPDRGEFRDYIAWLQSRDYSATQQWWTQRLGNVRRSTPLWVSRSAGGTAFDGQPVRLKRTIEEGLSAQLVAAARTQRTTMNIGVLTAWSLLLGGYAQLREVIIGTVVSGRPPELQKVESMVGSFINNVPLVVEWSAGQKLVELMSAVRADLVEMSEHEFASPADIQAWSGVGTAGRLFESLVLFQNFPLKGTFWGKSHNFKVGGLSKDIRTHFPVSLVCVPHTPIELELILEGGYWDETTAGKLLDDFIALLTTCLLSPETSVDDALGAIPLPDGGSLMAFGIDEMPVSEPPSTERLADVSTASIIRICKDVLGLDEVSADDNLFELGARSVQLVELHRRLVRLGDNSLTLTEMFEFPTVSQLVNRLSENTSAAPLDNPVAATERAERIQQGSSVRQARSERLRRHRNSEHE